jgi:leader peptidase (prepilin peptidase) / N-methyltransferase
MWLPPFAYSLFGLILGSFLNVCIHRIPRRESVAWPGSHCPSCGVPIRAYDNIPLVSYLLLRGRCRSCKTRISLRYPLVELSTGIAFYACASVWEFEPPTFVNSLFIGLIIVLALIDYDHQILPNVFTLPGTLIGILLSPFQAPALYREGVARAVAVSLSPERPEIMLPWVGSLLGAIVGAAFILLTGFLYQIARKRQGLGMGDVKMMAMVGAFLGWRLALLTIFAGSLSGSLVGIFLIRFRGESLQTKLSFGTFLGCGAVIALFFGLPFIHWYTHTL